MKIRIKLYASLEKHLPEGTAEGHTGNEANLEFDADTPIGDVIDRLALPLESCHLVLVNGIFVSPSERDGYVLAEGDHLAIWPPVAGG